MKQLTTHRACVLKGCMLSVSWLVGICLLATHCANAAELFSGWTRAVQQHILTAGAGRQLLQTDPLQSAGCSGNYSLFMDYTNGFSTNVCFKLTRPGAVDDIITTGICPGVDTLVTGQGAAAVTADIVGMGFAIGRCQAAFAAAYAFFTSYVASYAALLLQSCAMAYAVQLL